MVESDNQMKEDGISQVFWLEGIEDNIKLHLTETNDRLWSVICCFSTGPSGGHGNESLTSRKLAEQLGGC